jgi:hypothetical protein
MQLPTVSQLATLVLSGGGGGGGGGEHEHLRQCALDEKCLVHLRNLWVYVYGASSGYLFLGHFWNYYE